MEAIVRTVPYNHDTKEAGPESHNRLIHLRALETLARISSSGITPSSFAILLSSAKRFSGRETVIVDIACLPFPRRISSTTPL